MSIVVGCILMCINTRVIIIIIENHKLFFIGTLPQPASSYLSAVIVGKVVALMAIYRLYLLSAEGVLFSFVITPI